MTAEYKRLIPGLGCRNGKPVRLDAGEPFLEMSDRSLTELCRHYSDHGADELLILDLSETDEDHEVTIGTLKEIAREVDTPIITGGRVKRLEDVKKYLYAGASAVFLDVSIDENVDLMKEASSRFGSEKIYAYLPDLRYVRQAEEFTQLGASKMILDVGQPTASSSDLCRLKIPFLTVTGRAGEAKPASEDPADALSAILQLPGADGVILLDSMAETCMSLKQSLKAEGIQVDTFETAVQWSQFKLNSDGLIPVIVQDYKTNEVLMMAYMNEEAFEKTLATGTMTYFSRSRRKLWLKGETSGHFQYVKSLTLDCDNDTILAKVHQIGAACHTGNRSCFFQTLAAKEYKETNPLKIFEDEYSVIQDRKEHPKEGSYTNYLFDKGIDKILKKVGEEATEIIIAAKNPDPEEIKYEIADFLYHVMVLMVEKGVTWEEITKEVANR